MGIIYKNGIPYGNQPSIDATLAHQGEAADAKAAGDAVSELRNTLNHKADVITDTASGDIASFPDGADGLPVKDLTVAIEPVQSGTGDPSPENVRPISGWTGCNVSRMGKNLLPMTVENLKSINVGGTWNGNVYTYNNMTFTLMLEDDNVAGIRVNGTSYSSYNYFYITSQFQAKSGSEYIISGSPQAPSSTTWRFWVESTLAFPSGNRLSDDSAIDSRRTAFGDETMPVYIQIFAGQTLNNAVFYPMIRLASDSDSTYEPYSGVTIPISWQSSAGTVYGGTLDVTSGVLTVTMASVDLGTLNPLISSLVSNGVAIPISNAKAWTGGVYLPNGLNSAYKKVLSNEQYFTGGAEWTIRLSRGDGGILISNPQWAGKTVEQIKADLSGVYYCYELATPQTYQLTPEEVTTLLGQNNIWADCGPSTVEYPCDTKLYIQKINTPTDDDMIADANIANGQYFIVNNNLYLSTAAILAGDPIKPGTNCTLTNLAAALNALNS